MNPNPEMGILRVGIPIAIIKGASILTLDSWMMTLGDAVGVHAIVDYKLTSNSWVARVYATGDVEMAKRAAYLTFPDLELAMSIDKGFNPSLKQTYILNLPQEW